jgi:predicted secreted protein
MSITSAFVLYCVIWAILFYMINPLWQTSQSEDGKVTPGTPASAPIDPMIRKKVIITTVIATALFVLAMMTLEFGWITLDDVSFLKAPSEGG